MARPEPLALALLALGLALSAWAPPAAAGTQEAPEVTDPAGDQEFVVVPTGEADQFTNADVLACWFAEDADNLYVSVQIAGDGVTTTTTGYTWTVHMTVGAEDKHATATSGEEQPTPGEAATAASVAGGIINLTVPKSAVGAVKGTAITGIAVEAEGDFLATGVLAASDTAPDGGEEEGGSYTVTGGAAPGSPGDADGDGLNDTVEEQQFGGTAAQNGTGDPDSDGLNNTAEFAKGTNATKADTDGDGTNDKDDPFPLDPAQGGAAGNSTADLDQDGLPDSWERQHFNSTTAQKGTGDPDSDGLDNAAEHEAGTDPLEADTDGDGLSDASDERPLEKASDTAGSRPELYAGAAMFAAAATFLLFALARGA